jgi:c(7)-type cytochrome triheme protein
MKKTLITVLLVIITLYAGLIYAGDIFHGGDVLYTKPVKAVLFSHQAHVEDMGMGCDMCHPALFGMVSLQVQESNDFTMLSFSDGKYCGACHDGSWAFDSDSQCARCHVGVKGLRKITGQPMQMGH